MSEPKQEEQKDPEARSSKKAHVDQNEEELEEYPLFADVSDGMGIFGKLPTEILEKVCNDLNPRDIINLTKTCKGLNKQISLNKYIMKNITLRIPTLERISDVDFGKRTYVNLVYTDFKHIRPGFKKIAANLQSITFPKKAYYSSAVEALSYMPNVRKVIDFPYRINFGGRHPGILADPEALNFTNLKKLTMKSAGQELRVFEGCHQLEHFAAIQVECPTLLQKFLNKQNSLQSLEFTWPIDPRFYASEEDLAFQFNLKKLRINLDFGFTTAVKDNIERFLNAHRESLISFSTNNIRLLTLLQDFPVLNEISLKFSNYATRNLTRKLPLMPLVEKLDVEYVFIPRKNINRLTNDHVYVKFPSFDSFPNLKEFRGKKLHSRSTLAHNAIEVISLDSCAFPDISMPKLKSAKFTNIEGRSVMKWVEAVIENPFAELKSRCTKRCRNREKICAAIKD